MVLDELPSSGMPFMNTSAGYGLVTKALHWVIVAIMSVQFGVGYLITRVDDDLYESIPGLSEDRLFAVHMSLGASVLFLALLRLTWRKATPLPPWAPTLSHFERRYEHRVEQVLYVLMLAIPISGVLAAMADGKDVVFFGAIELPPLISEDSDLDDLTVGFHIAGHLAFFAAFALHVGLVIKHQLVNRDRLLNRML
jgi:cytochrome b561